MTFAEELEVYRKNNPYQTTQIGEQKIEYLLCGNPDSKDVLDMVPDAKVVRVDGGHVATLYKVGDYVKATREFIEAM